ncbi:hypothetical protein, partial [Candidatus Entotheonella palauensis]|uniref:hypothetical protein n=1 Tax=Candidatus Entotheonella palauensis TaxID=93172 RepID=UPI001C4DEDC6
VKGKMIAHQVAQGDVIAYDDSALARYGRGVFLEIVLRANGHTTPAIRVRVDSAVSFCVFGRQWADILALEWEVGDHVTIRTAMGVFSAYGHDITLHLLDYEWTAWIVFAEWDTTPPTQARDVLGLTGFFDHFLVAIDDLSEVIYLEPHV